MKNDLQVISRTLSGRHCLPRLAGTQREVSVVLHPQPGLRSENLCSYCAFYCFFGIRCVLWLEFDGLVFGGIVEDFY